MEVRALQVGRVQSNCRYVGNDRSVEFCRAHMIFEWPHPQIDQDWDSGDHQWREITPLAYCELKKLPLRYEADDAFMQTEPVDILPDGDGLYVCCKRESGFYFARLLPASDWWKRNHLLVPVPKTGVDPLPNSFKGTF